MGQMGTYDTTEAKELSLAQLIDILKTRSATQVFIKKLAPNDNSKNQPYFGGHLTDLSFIPSGELVPSASTSGKTNDPKRKIKYFASLNFSWVDATGTLYPADNAKLIYYPQYPEVRFSGFLKGSKVVAGEWMDPYKQGRSEGRWLILGITPDERVLGYLVTPECKLSCELEKTELIDAGGVFQRLPVSKLESRSTSSRDALISKLRTIHEAGWLPSQRMTSDLSIIDYEAQNGGGYTLEAQLGIPPNGYAEPDYLGWEVKQFGVTRFPRVGAKPTTLMTPEPDGGFYKQEGATMFVRRYGYEDQSGKPDRLNFGGKHVVGQIQARTGLTLKLIGFDANKSQITDATGCIALLDDGDNITASWSFAKLMSHWKRKHTKAVYIPSLRRKEGNRTFYHYGKDIELGVGTDLELVLKRLHSGFVFYDPGIKLEHASTASPKIKKRSQFRVNHSQLDNLYRSFDYTDIMAA